MEDKPESSVEDVLGADGVFPVQDTETQPDASYAIPDRSTLSSLGFHVPPQREESSTPHTRRTGTRGRKPMDPTTLRLSQLRTLAILMDYQADSPSSAISITQVSKVLGISEQTIKQGLGATREDKRLSHDHQFGYQSLITRGLVIIEIIEREPKYYLSMFGIAKCEDLADQLKEARLIKPRTGGLDKRTGPKVPNPNKVVHKKRQGKRTL
ncbi:unnamed protein product [Sphagnum balticum]